MGQLFPNPVSSTDGVTIIAGSGLSGGGFVGLGGTQRCLLQVERLVQGKLILLSRLQMEHTKFYNSYFPVGLSLHASSKSIQGASTELRADP